MFLSSVVFININNNNVFVKTSESGPNDDVVFTNENLQQAFLKQDNVVKVDANVEAFRIDRSSGTKFIELKADSFYFDAIIYKGIKVPYIYEGRVYTFHGITQEYKGKIELQITSIQ